MHTSLEGMTLNSLKQRASDAVARLLGRLLAYSPSPLEEENQHGSKLWESPWEATSSITKEREPLLLQTLECYVPTASYPTPIASREVPTLGKERLKLGTGGGTQPFSRELDHVP